LDAVILAGGLGTRISSVLPDLPKCLAPIRGRPAIEIILDELVAIGAKAVVVAAGYRGDQVRNHLGSEYRKVPISYSFDGDQLLGTGGAIRKAMSSPSSNPILVVNGDTLQEFHLAQMLEDYEKHNLPVIHARRVPNAAQFGTIVEQDGFVVSFLEKTNSGSGLVNSGCYLLPAEVFSGWDLPEKFSFENDFLPKLGKLRKLRVVITEGGFTDFGTPEEFFRSQEKN
jgi:D-glycero-alpha-D-manno-heptose 1-phosphate guanylyltransferase